MITWKDFILDDVMGPSLSLPWDNRESKSCREERLGSPNVMEDEIGIKSSIQETGQEQRPARMVGLSSLDSVETDTEVSRDDRANSKRQQRGRG